jgi:hypothetical protein
LDDKGKDGDIDNCKQTLWSAPAILVERCTGSYTPPSHNPSSLSQWTKCQVPNCILWTLHCRCHSPLLQTPKGSQAVESAVFFLRWRKL